MLIPYIDAVISIIFSLFPIPCSLKNQNFVPHSYDNCYK
ncbi:hypothetical protein LYNGBM3L_06900 [Moorena producens 3L]|uniref:Uncharacterized protein n=1 Tax=Moorena producens 3L TaxID=489825 RepID=F4XJP6_9CYAN|nr:hypothetical protein LYNGBM3L_06900 [Moorena producens 3L]